MAGKAISTLVAVVVLSTALAFTGPAQATECKQLSFVGVAGPDTFVADPTFPAWGTRSVFVDPVKNLKKTKTIGETSGRCDGLKVFGTFYCIASAHIFGRGIIDYTGVYSVFNTSKISVIGGSGEFVGARGYMDVTLSPDGLSTKQIAYFTTSNCT